MNNEPVELQPTEEWRPITGFENYQVSSHGRMRNLSTNHFLSLKPNKRTGYTRVGLYSKGTTRYVDVHVLVAEAFIPKPVVPSGVKLVVNHKKAGFEWRSFNHPSNLEWVTKADDCKHAAEHGFRVALKGTEKSQAKFASHVVLSIRETYAKGGVSLRQLAKQFNVHRRTIWGIVNGLSYQDVTQDVVRTAKAA